MKHSKSHNMKQLIKYECEIESCNVKDPALLHKHHIIERGDIGTSNDEYNCAILCANHHYMLHDHNRLKIIGVYPSSHPPNGRSLVYELDGKRNIDIDDAYFNPKPIGMNLIQKKK